MPQAKRKRDSEAAAADDSHDDVSASDNDTRSSSPRNRRLEPETPMTLNGVGKLVGDIDGGGENGEAGLMRMEAPPKGIIHPAGGYKTNDPPTDRPVRVYADGVFDLFHLGHMRQLEQAKSAFPNIHLLVGVTGDRETHKRKGLTVMSAKERSESVRHCKWVDEVIEDCPWVLTVDFLQKHNIDYVAHDDLPYGASEGDDIYKPIKEAGMFLVTQRTEGVSTTGIITRIVKDYESYISRQLHRGTSRQELNISWFKKNELDIKRQVSEIRKSIKENWTTTGQELGKEFRQFWQQSGASSPALQLTPAAGSIRGRPTEVADAALESPTGTTGSWARGARSPGGWSRLTAGSQHDGPIRDKDFAVGYAMGLIGGVRSWMQRTRRTLSDTSRAPSPHSSDEADGHNGKGSTAYDSDNDEDEDEEESARLRKRGRVSRDSTNGNGSHESIAV